MQVVRTWAAYVLAALFLSACSTPSAPPDPTIVITSEQPIILAGSTYALNTQIEVDGAKNAQLRWTSSNEDVAMVDEHGIVFGLTDGVATIRAAFAHWPHKFSEVEVQVVTGLMGAPGMPFTLEIDTAELWRADRLWPFLLGLTGQGTIVVHWGDGMKSIYTNPSGALEHRYEAQATYTITVSGTLTDASFAPTSTKNYVNGPPPSPFAYRKLFSWGNHEYATLARAFSSAKHLIRVPADLPAGVTDLTYMFAGAEAFNQPIGQWNTSEVTSMKGMFDGASMFDQPLDQWNTSNVTDMSAMFRSSGMRGSLAGWDTSNVVHMQRMFSMASHFANDLRGWCVARIAPNSPGNYQFDVMPGGIARNSGYYPPAWGLPCN